MTNQNFVISSSASIREALILIEENHKGFILVADEAGVIIGMSTDGDIRRKLLEGVKVEDSITACVNRDYIWASIDTPREVILKQLDHKIRAIPVLDRNQKLIAIFTADHLPEMAEVRTFSRAKSPVRVSFGGGGSDISAYFTDHGGAVINATISLYSHATLKLREDERIFISSLDLGEIAEFSDLSELLMHKGKFQLVQSIIKAINPSFGFELFLYSDFPMNSGLGGSAVVSAAILGCFNELRTDKWDLYELAEIAFQAERLHLGVAGGWQDQYATIFGGFNFMEFNRNQNIIHPIRIPKDVLLELEESLILCYTNTNHDSGNIHQDQKEQTKNIDVKERIQLNVDLTYEIRNLLLRGNLNDFGLCLDKAWQLKRSFSSKISNSTLDEIYAAALQNGATGGKLLGAGGGGYFLFYVPAFGRNRLMRWIKEEGLIYTPFKFEEAGVQSWTVREKYDGADKN
jgi:D-glycero-alpha-D-manno-heptose-7-phosphate kinase